MHRKDHVGIVDFFDDEDEEVVPYTMRDHTHESRLLMQHRFQYYH